MKILIANDHAGFNLKKELIPFLQTYGEIVDLGSDNNVASDYPLFAKSLCTQMTPQTYGILICGSGIGICIAANRFKHIRAAVCHSVHETILARRHNDINVLCLGARTNSPFQDIIKSFLETPFLKEERHIRRIEMIS